MKPFKLFTVFFLILTTHTVFSQHSFGIKANAGVSSTYRKLVYSNSITKSYFRPSAQMGAFYRYQLKEKFILGSEVLFSLINGKEYWTTVLDTVPPSGNSSFVQTSYNHLYGISFPIYVGYNIRKTNIHFGPQFNFYVASKIEQSSSFGQSTSSHTFYNWYRKFDIGARAGVIYSLSKNFLVEVNAYWGISSLTGNNRWGYINTLKIRQVTLGVRYTLFSNDKKKKK